MPNVHRLTPESTPYETFRDRNPSEHAKLVAVIAHITQSEDSRAAFCLQEVTNELHRAAFQRLKDMGIG